MRLDTDRILDLELHVKYNLRVEKGRRILSKVPLEVRLDTRLIQRHFAFSIMPLTLVSYGGGTNSTAMLIGLAQRRERVDLILFADPGAEMPETQSYVPMFSEWCQSHGLPPIVTVKAKKTIEDDCLTRKALPAIAYGFKTCSQRFKKEPQDKYVNNWPPARFWWMIEIQIVKLIGYDAGEPHRFKPYSDKKYTVRYPLGEWGWDREDCENVILKAGLPLPGKSSCFFCPSMKPGEIKALNARHPELIERAITLERNAELVQIKGLGRNYSWESLLATDAAQGKLFAITPEIPCECYD